MAVIELDLNSAGKTQRRQSWATRWSSALDETPTSGYRWALEALDEAILAALDDAFTPPEPGLLGGSGRHRFRFADRRSWPGRAAAGASTALGCRVRGGTFETTIDAALRADGDEDVATETDEGEPGP